MKTRIKNGIRVIAIMLVLGIMLTACGNSKEYSLGTGNLGGNYYSYGNALAGILKTEDSDLVIDVKTTAGSAANLRLLQKGFLDMAIVQSDTLYDAYTGNGVFDGEACSGVRAVAGLYTEECQIVVRNDSDIWTVEDLYGKSVSVGEEESGVMQNAEQILLANGITFSRMDTKYLSFSDSAAALKNGEIDAFFCTAGAPTTSVQELSKEVDIRILSIDERTCQQLINEYPSYSQCIIPAGTYEGQEDDINTLGVKAVLVVSNKVSDDFVTFVVENIFSHSAELQYATSAQEIDINFATSAIPVPFHNGASSYYEQKGFSVNTSDNGATNYGVNAPQD